MRRYCVEVLCRRGGGTDRSKADQEASGSRRRWQISVQERQVQAERVDLDGRIGHLPERAVRRSYQHRVVGPLLQLYQRD